LKPLSENSSPLLVSQAGYGSAQCTDTSKRGKMV